MASLAAAVAEAPSATKERLLDVAERLFAEQGFDSVSLRSITAEAGANLAAVNYHFGSKQALVSEVVARLIEPVNRERLILLEAVDTRCAGAIDQIVAAFLDPVMAAAAEGGARDNRFCKLMSRCIAARDERISRSVMQHFPEIVERFVDAIRDCLPQLSSDAAHMRLLFMAGAMAQSLFHYDKLGIVSQGRCEVPRLETLRSELGSFLSAGLSAAATRAEG